MCYLCRFHSAVFLHWPLLTKKGSKQHYDNLEKDLLDFDYRSSALPYCLSLACMDDGCGITKNVSNFCPLEVVSRGGVARKISPYTMLRGGWR